MKVRIAALFVALTVLVFVLSGCKNEVDEFITLFEEMADVAEETNGDCAKQLEALNQYVEDNKGRIDEVGKKIKENDSMMTSGQHDDLKVAVDRFQKATQECPEAAFSIVGLVAYYDE